MKAQTERQRSFHIIKRSKASSPRAERRRALLTPENFPLSRTEKRFGYVLDGLTKGKSRKRKGPLIIVATTELVDWDGDIIRSAGCTNIEAYSKDNPLLLWMHDGFAPPIGHVEGYEAHLDDKNHTYTPVFSKRSEFPKLVEGLMMDGDLNASSIRFVPEEIDEPEFEEQMGVVIVRWAILENSIVTIPANMEALAAAAKRYQSVGKHIHRFGLPPGLVDSATRTGIVAVPKFNFGSLDEIGRFAESWCNRDGLERKGAFRGTTEVAEDNTGEHAHGFVVEIDEENDTIFGTTDEENDHAHPITKPGMTDEAGDPPHIHEYSLEEQDDEDGDGDGGGEEQGTSLERALKGLRSDSDDMRAEAGHAPEAGSALHESYARTVNPT